MALVTGGNGGIGLGMAQGLAAAGATVVIAGRDEAKNAAAAQELGAAAIALAADVTDEQSCRAMVERGGRSASAGSTSWSTTPASTSASSRRTTRSRNGTRVLDTNLTSAFVAVAGRLSRTCKSAGGGKIVNIGSMMSIFGASFAAPYAASKGGIVQLTTRAGHRLGEGQHPGERGAAGLDRHRR